MPRQCCGMQMGCTNRHFCPQKDDLIHDPTVMTWMRATPPPPVPLHSKARVEATQLLKTQVSYLESLDIKLDHARRRVEAAFKKVEDILLQIREVRLDITKRRASLAPIRCLPIEILGCILASVDPPTLPEHARDISGLYSVSKVWNQALTLAPDLWTNLDIASQRHLVEKSTPRHERLESPTPLERCLLKSIPRPLLVSIRSDNIREQLSAAAISSIFQSLPRWERLQYECLITEGHDQICLCNFLYYRLNQVIALKELDWMPCTNWGVSASPENQSIQLDRLAKLSLRSNMILLPCLRTPFLTELSIYGSVVTVEDLSSMAVSMPNLLFLRCDNIWFHGKDTLSIPFRRLRDFYLNPHCHQNYTVNLVLAVLRRSPTLLNIRHSMSEWGKWRNHRISKHEYWTNISFVELSLDIRDTAIPDSNFGWNWPGAFCDLFVFMPNLEIISLRWISDSQRRWSTTQANNNRFAANLLSGLASNQGICRHLKRLNCYGVPCNETFVGKNCLGTFLLTLEAFAESRSRIREGEDQSSKTDICLVSIAWELSKDPAQPPDIVNATWEVLSAFLENAVEEEFSDDDETEESECSWNGDDSSESELDVNGGNFGDDDDEPKGAVEAGSNNHWFVPSEMSGQRIDPKSAEIVRSLSTTILRFPTLWLP